MIKATMRPVYVCSNGACRCPSSSVARVLGVAIVRAGVGEVCLENGQQRHATLDLNRQQEILGARE